MGNGVGSSVVVGTGVSEMHDSVVPSDVLVALLGGVCGSCCTVPEVPHGV
jgi:hypothetical protein